jgi:uncharacterized membrane protein
MWSLNRYNRLIMPILTPFGNGFDLLFAEFLIWYFCRCIIEFAQNLFDTFETVTWLQESGEEG